MPCSSGKEVQMKPLLLAVAFVLLPIYTSAQDKEPPTDKEKLEALLKDLKSKDVETRYEAIMALAEFGPDANAAVPELVRALQEPSEDLRVAAALTLGKIGKGAVKSVAELLTHKDTEVRFYALWAVGNIGPEAKETAEEVL